MILKRGYRWSNISFNRNWCCDGKLTYYPVGAAFSRDGTGSLVSTVVTAIKTFFEGVREGIFVLVCILFNIIHVSVIGFNRVSVQSFMDLIARGNAST